MDWTRLLTVLPAFCWLVLVGTALAEGRVALVIGNSAYERVSTLANPVNDATDLAAALERIGFVVTLATNLDAAGMRQSLRAFRDVTRGADTSLVYFAGHGIEIDKQNYLVPVDAALQSAGDAMFDTIPIDLVAEAVSGATMLRMIILDACRNNPFQVEGAGRSIGLGLAPFEPIGGTLVAYAARAGTIAMDGAGRNSPFMRALLAHIEEPGVDVSLLFRRVRDSVLAATNNRQEPFTYGSLPGHEIYLVPPIEQVSPPTEAASTTQEDLAWGLVRDSDLREELRAFISAYPQSKHVPEAIERLVELSVPLVPATTIAPTDAAEPVQMAQLIGKIQTQLARLGCNPGPADGVWGRTSRHALASFADSADTGFDFALQPTPAVLRRLEQESLDGGKCIATNQPTANQIVDPGCRAAYQRWIRRPGHKAFAVSPDGWCGDGYGFSLRREAEEFALNACNEFAGGPGSCALYDRE